MSTTAPAAPAADELRALYALDAAYARIQARYEARLAREAAAAPDPHQPAPGDGSRRRHHHLNTPLSPAMNTKETRHAE